MLLFMVGIMTESENIQDRFKLNKYIAVIYDAFSYYAKLSPERAECIFLGLHGVGEETIGDIIIFSPDGDHQRAREAFEDVEGLLIETCRYIHGLQVVNGPAEGQIITSLKSLLNHFINPDCLMKGRVA